MKAPAMAVRAPAVLVVARARARVELLVFIRERISVVFTFFFPILLLVVLGSIFHGQRLPGGVDLAQYFVAGMVGAGLFGVSFQNVAIAIPIERDIGVLKRLIGTPMPKTAYFLGKMAVVAFVALSQNVLLLGLGSLLFGLRLPDTVDRWFTYLWVIALGIASCTILGIAASGLVRNGRTAPAVMSPIAIVLQFISGVYFVFATEPPWMQTVAAIFPLKWIAQGMRSVFLPDEYRLQEPAGSWELDRVALVLAAWCLLGFLVAVRTFRWRRADD